MGFMARSAIPIAMALHAWSSFTHHRTLSQTPRHALTYSREQADREPEQLDFSTPSLGAPGAPPGARTAKTLPSAMPNR